MALIKCKECGKEISDKANHCIYCGCPKSDMIDKKCSECGNKLNNTDSVCSKCGCPTNIESNNLGKKLSFLKNKNGKYSILKIIGLILCPFIIWYIVSWIMLFIRVLFGM